MKYGFNFLLTAVTAFIIAVLSFLIGNECGVPSVPTAVASGFLSGVAMPLGYNFGGMMAGETFDWKKLTTMLVAGVVFGVLGGLSMSWF